MPKAKPAPPPTKIQIHDELGQIWDVDSQDDLWEEVRTLTKDGAQDAVLPISIIRTIGCVKRASPCPVTIC